MGVLAAIIFLLPFSGCGLTLGPTVEKKAIIVRAGTAIEIIEDEEVMARILTGDGNSDLFSQNVGGWIAMHPDHWDALKREIDRLKKAVGE